MGPLQVGQVACGSVPAATLVDGNVSVRSSSQLGQKYGAWKEMVESIRHHHGADLSHTLNSLTLPDWPLRLVPLDEEAGQLDVDRFYRYNQSLQEFFDEAAAVDTRFAEEG